MPIVITNSLLHVGSILKSRAGARPLIPGSVVFEHQCFHVCWVFHL